MTVPFPSNAVVADAYKHALAEFPRESCGFVADGVYVACENKHPTPETHFEINDPRYEAAMIAGTITAIIHSHPHGPDHLSEFDLAQQIATNVPWIVINLNTGDR